MSSRVVFFAPPTVTLLDLFGPLQAFQVVEAVGGPRYDIEICALTPTLATVGNVQFTNLRPFDEVQLQKDDILFVSGGGDEILRSRTFLDEQKPLFDWIRSAWCAGTTICSICSGSYLLAEAGILDGTKCAAHWTDVEDFQQRYPKLEVSRGILFTQSTNVFTSAGIASGIDLAIHLLGQRHGARLAFDVARYLVVYLRRSGDCEQESIYLKYRNHLDDLVHRAQSLLIERLDRPPSLEGPASEVGSSARNLSRRFRLSLGISFGDYLRKLRLERARVLLQQPGSKVDDVARACGFNGARQLRNMFRERYGHSPRERPLAESA